MPRRLALDLVPIQDWPDADRAAWHAALNSGDPLDDAGPLAGKSAERLSKFRAAYGRWLGFLAERGSDAPPARGNDQFTGENVSAFVSRLNAVLAPCSVRAYLTDLYTVARALAPGREFHALRGAMRHIWRTAKPVTDKRRRLVPARDLYDLGFDLMQTAATRSTRLKQAGQFVDGLMIALLAARPVRRANLLSIQIGNHLECQGDNFWLTFQADEVKTRRTLEFPLPRALTPPMQHYLDTYRPFLIARNNDLVPTPLNHLWISANGKPLGWRRLHERICSQTQRRFSLPINPHLFRDAAATSIAIEDPEHVRIILAILGHSTIRTAQAYYNQATTIEAARTYHNVVAAFR